MLNATIPGWKIECVGDDIAWLKIGPDGRFWAINPESGFFGVAPGTSYKSNPNAMKSCEKDTIFTNVALTEDGDVWWEGMTKEVPKGKIITWLGKEWSADSGEPKPNLAHPNSRFTARVENCPVGDPGYYALEGVPVSAIIFGGRRENTVPLVFQSRNWKHGVLLGSAVASETTAAAEAAAGQLRFDPFAMLPFCGYNMGDYFGYWLTFADKCDAAKLPKIFHVNWFRKENGRFLWPGYGENSRVLKWIIERVEGKEGIARETPIGWLPTKDGLDLSGLDIPDADLEKILSVDCKAYLSEVEKIRVYHSKFGDHLPKDLVAELDALEARLKAAL
jgi:phosphoenolpyruvate carboxykinase (GTP)